MKKNNSNSTIKLHQSPNMIKKYSLYLSALFLFQTGCMSDGKVDLSLEGDLNAKNVLSVQSSLPEGFEDQQYAWYLGSSPNGEWEKLPGIFTKEIVLLISYKDKYVKCDLTYSLKDSEKKETASIVSSQAIGVNGNPNTDWMRDAGYGLMVHYLVPVRKDSRF
jgi:hypothetical protein